MIAALVALAVANSPLGAYYQAMWETVVAVRVGPIVMSESLRHWINDGLMTVFVFAVGLEVKDELVNGQLRDRRQAVLPVVAALVGVVVPAACYLAVNPSGPARHGWAIPVATDIAFALAVLSLFGIPCAARAAGVPWSRSPSSTTSSPR